MSFTIFNCKGLIETVSSISKINFNKKRQYIKFTWKFLRKFLFSMLFACLSTGCVSLGNPDLDFDIRISDFAIERKIQKQISPPKNPSSGWISIKKPKSEFHGFPFHHSVRESEKRICRTVLVNSSLLFANYACAPGCSPTRITSPLKNPLWSRISPGLTSRCRFKNVCL